MSAECSRYLFASFQVSGDCLLGYCGDLRIDSCRIALFEHSGSRMGLVLGRSLASVDDGISTRRQR